MDLVRRGVTTPKKLGIVGANNGGLLTSVMLTQHPEMFGAVVSKVPLTDMQRYHKLLAGASWMSEYGGHGGAAEIKQRARMSTRWSTRSSPRACSSCRRRSRARRPQRSKAVPSASIPP